MFVYIHVSLRFYSHGLAWKCLKNNKETAQQCQKQQPGVGLGYRSSFQIMNIYISKGIWDKTIFLNIISKSQIV